MSLVTQDQLNKIMRQLNANSYGIIYEIADGYVKQKLSAQYIPSVETADGLATQGLQTRIASLFLQACQDFLYRDSAAEAKAYRKDAETLRETLRVLVRDDRRYFNSLMYSSVDLAAAADTPSDSGGRNREPTRLRSRCADRTMWALHRMTDRFEEIADNVGRDKKNITFFYCLGRQWGAEDMGLATSLALPTAQQANRVHTLLIEALRSVAPERLRDIKKTDYDPSVDGNEIRRLMRAGRKIH